MRGTGDHEHEREKKGGVWRGNRFLVESSRGKWRSVCLGPGEQGQKIPASMEARISWGM